MSSLHSLFRGEKKKNQASPGKEDTASCLGDGKNCFTYKFNKLLVAQGWFSHVKGLTHLSGNN